MILYNGRILGKDSFFEAAAIEDGKIKMLGSDAEIMSLASSDDDGRQIDLKGKLVLPGFIDSHAHGGFMMTMAKDKIDLLAADSIEEYLKIIETFISDHPDRKSYKGFGWQTPLFGEDGPDKELLDNICSTKPIVIKSCEGHAVWANSFAIRQAGVDANTENPRGGVITRNEDGSPRGTFKDEAQQLIEFVTGDDPVELYKETILEYQQAMAEYGYTAVTEMMVKKGSNLHKAFMDLADEDKLLIKCQLAHVVSPLTKTRDLEQMRDRKPYIKNKLIDDYYAKIFIDGVVESATAALKEAYSNNPGFYGELIWEDEELFETCIELDRMGYDLHFHVIGDRAVSQMIDAMEHVAAANGERQRRPVAAHVQLMDDKDIERMKNAGISVSANPYWFFKDEVYSVLNEFPLLGERADHQYPMKSLLDEGIVISAGSDYTITEDPNPLYAMKAGIQRVAPDAGADDEDSALNRKECVGFEEMLKCVTINGAYTMNIEDFTGTLEIGKLADMVVLDKDIFTESDGAFYEANVLMTISKGDIVYENKTL